MVTLTNSQNRAPCKMISLLRNNVKHSVLFYDIIALDIIHIYMYKQDIIGNQRLVQGITTCSHKFDQAKKSRQNISVS
jgi:hypothetical protein